MGKAVSDYYKELAELIGKDVVDDRLRGWFQRQVKKAKSEAMRANKPVSKTCEVIISDLNRRAGTKYRVIDDTVKLIKVLLDKGFKAEDFYRVHEVKVREWLDNDEMRVYLRPATLYRGSKFEGYLQQWYLEKQIKDKKKAKIRDLMSQKKELRWYEFKAFWSLVRHLNRLDGTEQSI